MNRPADIESLRRAGRAVQLPLTLVLHDGRRLELEQMLRLLPGKRIVARGSLDGQPVLAKVFIAARGARRHMRRELRGIHVLHDRGLPTPQLLASGMTGKAPVIITEWLDRARTLTDVRRTLDGAPSRESLNRFRPLMKLVAAMHVRGVWQRDIHSGNFLEHESRLLIIDGDEVRSRGNRPLSPARACDNLGRLLAELSPELDGLVSELHDAYRQAGGPDFSEARLATARRRHLERRTRERLARVDRDCSRFRVRADARRHVVVRRELAEDLAPVLHDPEQFMTSGECLKQGGNSTVVRARVAGRDLVVKRYNLKNPMVRLRRMRYRSRPWNAWREGRRLEILGVATPAPLALIRERRLGLYGRAWLITEHVPGQDIRERWREYEQGPQFPQEDARVLGEAFDRLDRARVTHGDMKGSNILWYKDIPYLTDLDAMKAHRREESFRRARDADRQRFLENWPEDAPLRQWLHNALPFGGAER